MKAIDAADRKILRILQENARTPNVEIARRLKLAPSAVLERIRKLERRGAIRGEEALAEAPLLEFGLGWFSLLGPDEQGASPASGDALEGVPRVEGVHSG